MIKLTATAIVHSVTPVTQVTPNFSKRELILDDSWEKDGEYHPSFVSIEFSNNAMSQLDTIYPGQRVTVEACINGREYNGRIYNTIRGRSVTPFQPTYSQQPSYPQQGYPQQSQQAAPMPGYQQAPQPTYPQQGYAPATAPVQSAAPQQTQPYPQPQTPGVADLPFPT